jgi:hypothetical protein
VVPEYPAVSDDTRMTGASAAWPVRWHSIQERIPRKLAATAKLDKPCAVCARCERQPGQKHLTKGESVFEHLSHYLAGEVRTMKRNLARLAISVLLALGFVVTIGSGSANAASDCWVGFNYGNTQTFCSTGNQYNYTAVNSASFPYSGAITGLCVTPNNPSTVYYNPQTTGVSQVDIFAC